MVGFGRTDVFCVILLPAFRFLYCRYIDTFILANLHTKKQYRGAKKYAKMETEYRKEDGG